MTRNFAPVLEEQEVQEPQPALDLPIGRRLLKNYVELLAMVSADIAGRKATDLFGYTRGLIKAPPKDVTPLGARRFDISGIPDVRHGYIWSRGKGTILLVHGWGANSSSMYSFVRGLQQQGFKVAAFDAPAHGVSPGHVTTMTDFKNSVKAVITELDDVVGMVAHSLGSISATGALAELGQEHQVRGFCLLAPPATLPEVIRRWSRGFLQLKPDTLKAMHTELWLRNGVPVEHWNIPVLGRDLEMPLLVLHDPKDDVVPFCESERIASQLPMATLEAVPGQGHVRILSDAAVVDRVAAFLRASVDSHEASLSGA